MSLLAKRIEEIDESDLDSLITLQVAESIVLDYKREFVGRSDKDRNEFLADVSSFANTSGGEIIIGISEINGKPDQIVGLDAANTDQEILRIEQIIRTGSRPAIAGVLTRAIPLNSGNAVLLIRIPKSWAAPHQIGQQGTFRFFARGSNGKYQMDVDALRSAFRQGPELAERIKLFRVDRLAKIISNNGPTKLPTGSKIVTHVVPLDSFATGYPINLAKIPSDRSILILLLQSGGTIRVNLDGLVALSYKSDVMDRAYAQLFRDGALEIVETIDRWEVRGRNFLPGQAFDEIVQTIIRGTQKLYSAINIQGPVAVMLTLLGMEDRFMGSGKQYGHEHDRPFGQSEIQCPEVVIDDLSQEATTLAFPVVNLAWNAAGYEQSAFYDKSGKWIGR
jgi:Schlafen, AlbA_2